MAPLQSATLVVAAMERPLNRNWIAYLYVRLKPAALARKRPFWRLVLYCTQHWKPLLNGYSGFLPMSYGRHWEAFVAFPDPSVIDALRAEGVTHIVVHMARVPDAAAALRTVPGVTLFAESDRIRIYRISGPQTAPR